MVKTYLDILSERGIRPFLTDEAFEELQKFDYKSQYAIWTGRRPPRTSVFRSFSRNTAGSAASPS